MMNEKRNSETEVIIERKSFENIDVKKHHFIEYETYEEVPSNSDYSYGKESSIVLRNKMTGQLERIQFVFCGASPTSYEGLYIWYWGHIKADGPNGYLVFDFDSGGKLKKISVSFAAKNPSSEEFRKMNEGIEYPAQITSMGAFRPKK